MNATANNVTFDVVYFWKGGREAGSWHEAIPGVYPNYRIIPELINELECAGYVAVRGQRAIGAPEGAPDERRFRALGL